MSLDDFSISIADTTLWAGCLLVATPQLKDPNFTETVILILQSNDDGTFGIVLNRKKTSPPKKESYNLFENDYLAENQELFWGGPVEPFERMSIFAKSADDGWEIRPTLSTDVTEPSPEDKRIFAGYAGWGSQQIQDEIDQGSWFVVSANFTDPFDKEPETLWHRVLERQGGTLKNPTLHPEYN